MPGQLRNLIAWGTALVVNELMPRVKTIGGWIDRWNKSGRIKTELHPREGYLEIHIKLPQEEEDRPDGQTGLENK